MSKPKFRIGKTLGTTIYRDNEDQPCAIVMNGGNRQDLARRIVDLLNTGQTEDEREGPYCQSCRYRHTGDCATI